MLQLGLLTCQLTLHACMQVGDNQENMAPTLSLLQLGLSVCQVTPHASVHVGAEQLPEQQLRL